MTEYRCHPEPHFPVTLSAAKGLKILHFVQNDNRGCPFAPLRASAQNFAPLRASAQNDTSEPLPLNTPHL